MIRRLLALLGTLAVVIAAMVLTGASGGDDEEVREYRIVFDNAFGIVKGGDLKIGGVIAGQTTGFELERKPPYRVAVLAELSKPGFTFLRKDARCDVRQQSLIGEYFVDCDIGEAREEIPDGGTIPVEQTSSTIPLDLIQNIMRRPYRERFRLIISELGTGLAGRSDDLNEVIRRAHPALRETTETFKILARQNRTIRDFITDADRVSQEVEPFREDVARWAIESSQTADIQASRAEELARYWNRLPVFLRELEPTMRQLQQTANRQIPTLSRLRTAAPKLERFLTEIQPFARSSRGSIIALGKAATRGSRAISISREEIAELRELAEDAPRLAKPLRQFLQTIDDRSRSYEEDPEAELRAPPAPDKTAYRDGQGYTGIESLMNYIYWQTLAINPYDELSHVLRIGLLQGGPCAPYSTRPTKEQIASCASWTGPAQPGVTIPDPTESPPQTPSAEREARSAKRRRAAGRGPSPTGSGGPRATEPRPGERDLSRPEIVLPPGVQELVDRMTGTLRGAAPAAPDPRRQDAEPLLDFLLAP